MMGARIWNVEQTVSHKNQGPVNLFLWPGNTYLKKQLVDAHSFQGRSIHFVKQGFETPQTMVSIRRLVIVHDRKKRRQNQAHVLCQARSLFAKGFINFDGPANRVWDR